MAKRDGTKNWEGAGTRGTSFRFDFLGGGYCTICCREQESCPKGTRNNHAIIATDLGEGRKWYCYECFDEAINRLITTTTTTDMLVEGDTVTIDGVIFEF